MLLYIIEARKSNVSVFHIYIYIGIYVEILQTKIVCNILIERGIDCAQHNFMVFCIKIKKSSRSVVFHSIGNIIWNCKACTHIHSVSKVTNT